MITSSEENSIILSENWKDQYPNWEKWSNARWAWEFLRRNEDFQKRCATSAVAELSKPQKNRLANEFGLLRYKAPDEGFESADGEAVRFMSTTTRLARVPAGMSRKTFKITISNDELIIGFNIAEAARSQSSLEAQLESAKTRIEAEIENYKISNNEPFSGAKTRTKMVGLQYLELLRILDLLSFKATTREIAALVKPPQKISTSSLDEIRDSVKPLISRARQYAKTEYRKIVLREPISQLRTLAADSSSVSDAACHVGQ